MSFEQILYEVAEGIATLTLNRPERLNAWTSVMAEEVPAALAQATADASVRVIILTGAGRGFCAGADMNRLTEARADAGTPRPKPGPPAFAAAARADFCTRYSYFPAVPKPIIAAINGPCAGIGLILALYCDLRFMSADAIATTAFSRRGLIAEHGVDWLLSRLTGPAIALDLLLSARRVGAEEALSLGLVNRVVPGPELMAQTRAYARELCDFVSPRSMAVMKWQIWDAQFLTLAEAIEVGNAELEKSYRSEDFREGIAHFVERRKPKFTGR